MICLAVRPDLGRWGEQVNEGTQGCGTCRRSEIYWNVFFFFATSDALVFVSAPRSRLGETQHSSPPQTISRQVSAQVLTWWFRYKDLVGFWLLSLARTQRSPMADFRGFCGA